METTTVFHMTTSGEERPEVGLVHRLWLVKEAATAVAAVLRVTNAETRDAFPAHGMLTSYTGQGILGEIEHLPPTIPNHEWFTAAAGNISAALDSEDWDELAKALEPLRDCVVAAITTLEARL